MKYLDGVYTFDSLGARRSFWLNHYAGRVFSRFTRMITPLLAIGIVGVLSTVTV